MEATPADIEDQLFSFRNVVAEGATSAAFPALILPSLLTEGRCDPVLFPAAVARFRTTGCTTSIFAGGREMIMGRPSEFDARMALVMFNDLVNRTIPGLNARTVYFRVVNRVASVTLGADLDMKRLSSDWKYSGTYEPTSFPGFKLKMDDLRCTFVVFPDKGKVNVAGCKSPNDLGAVAQRMTIFEPYKKRGKRKREEKE